MDIPEGEEGFLQGKLLLAMPGMGDPRFDRSVVYMCTHSDEGAMGLVVNKLADYISFPELLEQLDIDVPGAPEQTIVHAGGPVEAGRGFVLHSIDFLQDTTLEVTDHIGLTATVDILKAIAAGSGPEHSLLALGYAGWMRGQLENEIQQNGWLHVDADDDILFHADLDRKWPLSMAKLGIDVSQLSSDAGHA